MDGFGLPPKVVETLMPDHKGREMVVVLDPDGIPFGCYPTADRAYLYCREALGEALDQVGGYDGTELRRAEDVEGWEVWTVGSRGGLEYRILPVRYRE